MHKLVKIALIVVGIIGLILWFLLPDKDMPASEAIQSGPMNFMFIIMYLLLAVAVIFSLFFALKKLFSTPGSLKKALFVLGGLAVVVAISYGLSSSDEASEVVKTFADNPNITATESTVKKIGMGLNVFFILTIIAVGLMLWSGLKKLFVK